MNWCPAKWRLFARRGEAEVLDAWVCWSWKSKRVVIQIPVKKWDWWVIHRVGVRYSIAPQSQRYRLGKNLYYEKLIYRWDPDNGGHTFTNEENLHSRIV